MAPAPPPIRSEADYGPSAKRARSAKRDDSFAAGTKVVWDVDPEAETMTVYHGRGCEAVVFARGQNADAEPAMPGWSIAVYAIFG